MNQKITYNPHCEGQKIWANRRPVIAVRPRSALILFITPWSFKPVLLASPLGTKASTSLPQAHLKNPWMLLVTSTSRSPV